MLLQQSCLNETPAVGQPSLGMYLYLVFPVSLNAHRAVFWKEVSFHPFTKVGCTFSEDLVWFDPDLWRATIHCLHLEPYSGGLFSYARMDIYVYLLVLVYLAGCQVTFAPGECQGKSSSYPV